MVKQPGALEDPVRNAGNFLMNQGQWAFIHQYYPDYIDSPYKLMLWLHKEAYDYEKALKESQIKA